MTTSTAAKTPGFDHRIDIWFATDKRGRRVAYHWSYGAGRAVRISLADAELWIATNLADELPGHPLKGLAR